MIKQKTAFNIGIVLIIAAIAIYLYKRLPIDQEQDEVKDNSIVNKAMRGEPNTRNFKLYEFNSKDGVKVPPEYYGNVSFLMDQLEVIRQHFNNKPVKVHSGFRSYNHNKKVGGATMSAHLKAKAADITIKGYKPKEVQAGLRQLIAAGKIHAGGLGSYNSFTHYDTGSSRSWPRSNYQV